MFKIGTWNLGSAATEILILVPDVPATISGAPLERIVDRARFNIESWTGQTVGSVGIAEKYQPALLCLSQLDLLASMQLIGADANNLKLGDWSMSKGSSSNLTESMNYLEKRCRLELTKLGFGTRFFKANG